ncbi:hypothetical protein M441DRAFT_359870 [Trichoderma asperellum CBS 433.97]|uniref:Uncharacterized protein n=1 Tax=Trichoderma asperellum (strain ATCC 204424 / CBS 433.97 / NBRC 101777) TaxID=1042311 RepID=A0A2T3ZDF0_TRIA4|nr:hypothetical protein M441DRAFT_359870 [Trichoderma asperellum CBS 433.97]PTB42837.1 hypothetical protein M441DRAFT_359870 [Trichoderma asperellum CBS 433.97]
MARLSRRRIAIRDINDSNTIIITLCVNLYYLSYVSINVLFTMFCLVADSHFTYVKKIVGTLIFIFDCFFFFFFFSSSLLSLSYGKWYSPTYTNVAVAFSNVPLL